jgi:transaldolase/glucose-6-phosphate isomerase
MLSEVMIEDIQSAADIFRPIYDATAGADGFVSIEVSTTIAHDTQRTIAMGEDFHRRCDRPNVVVKIPAMREGLPAIRHMIGEGKNISVTLIFSVAHYADVLEAYLSWLEDLRQRGGDPSRVASVASFFVSRVDTKVEKLLAARVEDKQDPSERGRLEYLYGKAAIANSKTAYQRYRRLFSGPGWQALEQAGASPQRCLWASTSIKDPRYRDTMYIEELIGPNTVDTVPNSALGAFPEHGQELGIELDHVTAELETEGVAAFTTSYEALLDVTKNAVKEIRARAPPRQWHRLGGGG